MRSGVVVRRETRGGHWSWSGAQNRWRQDRKVRSSGDDGGRGKCWLMGSSEWSTFYSSCQQLHLGVKKEKRVDQPHGVTFLIVFLPLPPEDAATVLLNSPQQEYL